MLPKRTFTQGKTGELYTPSSLESAARHWPPNRGAVANAVYDTVRSSMKGQPDPLVERAIRQAQQEDVLTPSLFPAFEYCDVCFDDQAIKQIGLPLGLSDGAFH